MFAPPAAAPVPGSTTSGGRRDGSDSPRVDRGAPMRQSLPSSTPALVDDGVFGVVRTKTLAQVKRPKGPAGKRPPARGAGRGLRKKAEAVPITHPPEEDTPVLTASRSFNPVVGASARRTVQQVAEVGGAPPPVVPPMPGSWSIPSSFVAPTLSITEPSKSVRVVHPSWLAIFLATMCIGTDRLCRVLAARGPNRRAGGYL
jgi:hypothetical protein